MMNEAGEIITAVGGLGALLTVIGSGVAFVWNKVEARFTSIETKLDECERRELDSTERRATLLTVIELLWGKVREFDPEADVLGRAKDLLDKLKRKASEGHE